jgi:outer membrane putative beta-barrel porin/alpha-amylase
MSRGLLVKSSFTRTPCRLFLALLACSPLPSALHAAEPPPANGGRIVTDRPDIVESSHVVGKGRFQFETSVDYQRDKSAGVTTRTLTTPTLFRLGVTENLELRVESDGRTRERTEAAGVSDTQKGWADASVGFKWHMQEGDEKTGRPGIGWLIHADLDSGSRQFRGQGVRPSMRAVFEWDLPNDLSLGVMPGVIRDKDRMTGERFTAGILAAVLGKELSDTARVFAEVAATQIARQRYGGIIATFDLGAAYLLTKLTQVDVATRFGMNSGTPDLAVTAGLSVKF